jgi:CheY-like chemotaxis protein
MFVLRHDQQRLLPRNLLKEHGGSVVVPPRKPMNERDGSERRSPENLQRIRPLRILLVEDHADTRHALKRFVTALGHQAKFAQNIREALLLVDAETQRFDLLLSDLRLPDGDGWELLRRLEERGCRPARAIAVSGWGSKEDVLKSQAAGFEAHLVKPLAPDLLEATLRETEEALERGLEKPPRP